jgi:hypothetical protein
MTVNHTAHLYWVGVAVADVVLNCRGSVLEAQWAEVFRGARQAAALPIPVDEARADASGRDERRERARAAAGLDVDAIVLLTVGSAFKYLATSQVDFVASVERVLRDLPHGVLLVVGFEGDERWHRASDRMGGRIRTLGRLSQEELANLHDACDIYVEGFPFGTTTSLLEAALRGMPVVLAPAVCPPPFGTDGVAVDGIVARPASVAAFEREIVRLAGDSSERQALGATLRRSVASHHAGAGWRAHVARALGALPVHHTPSVPVALLRTPESIHEYWFRFHELWSAYYEEVLENSLLNAYVAGLRPPLTTAIWTARQRATALPSARRVPAAVLKAIANVLAPWTSPQVAYVVLKAARLLWCRGFSETTRTALAHLQGRHGRGRPVAPYAEYRVPEDTAR